MERFIVYHRDMWFFSSLTLTGQFGGLLWHDCELLDSSIFADWNFFSDLVNISVEWYRVTTMMVIVMDSHG